MVAAAYCSWRSSTATRHRARAAVSASCRLSAVAPPTIRRSRRSRPPSTRPPDGAPPRRRDRGRSPSPSSTSRASTTTSGTVPRVTVDPHSTDYGHRMHSTTLPTAVRSQSPFLPQSSEVAVDEPVGTRDGVANVSTTSTASTLGSVGYCSSTALRPTARAHAGGDGRVR